MRRFLTLVLTLAVLGAVLLPLSSCSGEAGEGVTEPAASSSDALTADQLLTYSILRDDNADQVGVRNGMTLREAFEEAGYSLRLTTDFYREGIAGLEILPNEILVGKTNREETAEFLDSLTPWQWGYALVGTKIVIAGHSSETTAEAVNAFIENIVKRTPLSFSEGDRYVFGDVVEGEGRVFSVLTVLEDGLNGLSEDDILSAVSERSPEIVIRVRTKPVNISATAGQWAKTVAEELLLDRMPAGYAVGFAGAAGETVTEIYYLESAYTFSAGESARLLSYPNLSESEKGALVYSVLRCRETGRKMIFAAADLPADGYASSRMRSVAAFLKYTAAYPTAVFGADAGLGTKGSSAGDDFFAAGYSPACDIAAEKSGEEDGSGLFFPFARTAVTKHEVLRPGLALDLFQEAAR